MLQDRQLPQEANPLELGLGNPAAAKLIIFSRCSGAATKMELKKAIRQHAKFKEVLVHQLLKWVPSDILDVYWHGLPARDAVVFGPIAPFFKKKTGSIESFLQDQPPGNEVVLCLGGLDSFSASDITWSSLLDYYEKHRGLRLVLLMEETVRQWIRSDTDWTG